MKRGRARARGRPKPERKDGRANADPETLVTSGFRFPKYLDPDARVSVRDVVHWGLLDIRSLPPPMDEQMLDRILIKIRPGMLRLLDDDIRWWSAPRALFRIQKEVSRQTAVRLDAAMEKFKEATRLEIARIRSLR